MPSIPQAIPLETGSESDSVGAYTEEDSNHTARYSVPAHLFINFLWNIFALSYTAITLPA